MIILKKIIVFLCCILISLGTSFAQEIQKSTKVEFIGGKNYYLHNVLSGQTLYAIAKAYNVTEGEINEANPDIKKGIKVGQIIKIPVKNNSPTSEFTIHIVKQGETLSQIAVDNKVKLDDIYKLNPGLSANIKPGQEIKIPKTQHIPESVAKGSFTLHIVQKNETLFGIARQYNVTVDDLRQANPGLNETIQIGQQIRVPVKAGEVKTPDKIIDTVSFECMKTGLLSSYNVGLLVPFYLERAVYIDTSDNDKSVKEYSSFTFIGFYEGFLIALDSLKNMGLSVKLMVDDVAEDSAKTLAVLEKDGYSDLHLMIGPFFSSTFSIVSAWTKEKKIKTVNPYTARSEYVKDNPYVFKNISSADKQTSQNVDYIRKTWPGCNIILVQSEKASDTDMVISYRKALYGPDSSFRDFSEVNYIKEGLSGISKNLRTDSINVVISFIHGEASISNFIRNMSDYSFKYPIVTFGINEWEDYPGLEVEYLLNINLHILSFSFVDYSKSSVQDFIIEYRNRYHTEPDKYAFAGFDIGMYYLNALRLYGKDFQNCLHDYHPELLQTKLEFEHNKGCGYENTNICIYRFSDFKLIDAIANPQTTIEINNR